MKKKIADRRKSKKGLGKVKKLFSVRSLKSMPTISRF